MGDWVNGQKNGKGIINFQNGHRYDGYLKNNKKHGVGKYVMDALCYVEGEW